MNKVLMIALHYYDYDMAIKKSIERYGGFTDIVYDRPLKYNVLLKYLGKKKTEEIVDNYQRSVLKELRKKRYDTIIVIVGHKLRDWFIKELRVLNPNATFVLYLWDSIANVENFDCTRELYDKIFSFDINDCNKFRLTHLPLFYLDEYRKNEDVKNMYDIYSTMVYHSDREEVAKKISQLKSVDSRRVYINIKVDLLTYARNLFYGNEHPNIHYIHRSISHAEDSKLMSMSRCILDIQHVNQTGLTMRTIECLGKKKKIITTNESIKEYDFFDNRNIQIINRNNPQIETDFLKTDYIDLDRHIYEKYSVNYWTQVILGVMPMEKYTNY